MSTYLGSEPSGLEQGRGRCYLRSQPVDAIQTLNLAVGVMGLQKTIDSVGVARAELLASRQSDKQGPLK
jgi:hypothetical protein